MCLRPKAPPIPDTLGLLYNSLSLQPHMKAGICQPLAHTHEEEGARMPEDTSEGAQEVSQGSSPQSWMSAPSPIPGPSKPGVEMALQNALYLQIPQQRPYSKGGGQSFQIPTAPKL
jgi:hypothetical protein